MSKEVRGFTLVELMITLVIAAILATLALPSYRIYVLRSQRADAMSALTRVQAAQEKYFLQNNEYASSVAGLSLPAESDNRYYTIDFGPVADSKIEFTVLATPRAGSGQDQDKKCQVFSLDHRGQKQAKDGGGTDTTAECWR